MSREPGQEKEPSYADVAELIDEMQARWGRQTSFRLDPDTYKANGKVYRRFWVVANCWKTVRDRTDTRTAGWWFRGSEGAYTMAAAMYYSLTAVYYALSEAEDTAERQAQF